MQQLLQQHFPQVQLEVSQENIPKNSYLFIFAEVVLCAMGAILVSGYMIFDTARAAGAEITQAMSRWLAGICKQGKGILIILVARLKENLTVILVLDFDV